MREAVADFYVRTLDRLKGLGLRLRLLTSNDYAFSQDFFSHNVPVWKEHLSGLARPGLRILEIGSMEGRSALWFLQNLCRHPGSTLTCVDKLFWTCPRLRLQHNLKRSGQMDQVTLVGSPSDRFLLSYSGPPFDLIYVDADHRAASVLLDGMGSWRLLAEGGVLIFDDYLWEPELAPELRPQPAIDMLLESWAGRFDELFRGYQLILRKKTL